MRIAQGMSPENQTSWAELGITVPGVVPPVAVYQPAVRDGDRVHTSGQPPTKDGQLMTPGKLGGQCPRRRGTPPPGSARRRRLRRGQWRVGR